jgi:Ser-tRNA(Ala) deacylase AlaX
MLGESWEEALDSSIEVTERPERCGVGPASCRRSGCSTPPNSPRRRSRAGHHRFLRRSSGDRRTRRSRRVPRDCGRDVTDVTDSGIVLSRTVFYARGGGQPGDTGVLRWDGGETDRRHGPGRGVVTHIPVEGEPLPEPGMAVEGIIDWDRRYRTMRTHTALHALSGVVFRDFGAKVTGGNMEPGTARMDFELDGISQEFGKQVEDTLNAELVKGYPTEIVYLAREIALQDPGPDPDQGQPDPRVRRRDPGGRHRRPRPPGRRRDPRPHDPRGRPGPKVVKTESKGKANKRMRIELA